MKDQNTPTNTLREQIEDIIVDTTMHPVEQSLRIEALFSQAVNKAVLENLYYLYAIRTDDINVIAREIKSLIDVLTKTNTHMEGDEE